MTRLDQLNAAYDAMLAGIIAQQGYGSFSNDSESWSSAGGAGLEALRKEIIAETNRTGGGRREVVVLRGRRYAGWR